MARPSDYSDETADVICERIADGESLKDICADVDLPNRATVYRWLAAHKTFSDMYARAREEQADTLADEIVSISDDGARDYGQTEDGREVVNHDHIARSRLRVDARKWVAAKLKPRKYGDKVELEHSGSLQTQTDEQVNARLAVLLGKAGIIGTAGGTEPQETPEQTS